MTDNPGAGLGDPYWFEWSVGQEYVVDMLDPSSGISSVTLQRSGEKGLDDVIVHYNDSRTRCIQVKHTRVADTLTFGDLVAGPPSLLGQIAQAWKAEVGRGAGECEAWIVSNRELGTVQSTSQGDTKVVRPPLDQFLAWLSKEVADAKDLGDLNVPPDWDDSWTSEWLRQLDVLTDDAERLRFLQAFRVQGSYAALDVLGLRIEKKLAAMFAVDPTTAHRFSALLDRALRTWSTSLRGQAETITREAAYEKLCLIDDQPIGDHDLSPPAPFFETRVPLGKEIALQLAARSSSIAFLVGEPGSGKTSLISALASGREPAIDARYYAYRPITPLNQLLPSDAGRTTSARALWSDLLLQLRDLSRGQLLDLGVPLHAGSLSVDALRAHVLRVANELGARRGKPLVIAIDGIDHAARSGAGTDTLLSSLIPPDQVPPNVSFLIGGQLPDAYPAYPSWLRARTQGVERIDLPRLTKEDTLALLRDRLAGKPELELQNACQDIWSRCGGHTLSTVFAVEESALLGDELTSLGTHLDSRQLASGVDAYYEGIWKSATKSVSPLPSVTRLAACLCLMPVRVTPALLSALLDQNKGSSYPVDLLRQLRPLVVEDRDGFRVFHNDVRVYLLRLLQADPDVYQECSSRLADYVLSETSPAARHAVAHDLLSIAKRWADLAAMFTPRYVLEGHVIGRPLDALTEQGLRSVDAIAKLDQDWNSTHTVATGLLTLDQLRSSLEWRSAEPQPRRSDDAEVPTKLAERRVPPRAKWTEGVVRAALADIGELHVIGELHRAKAAFRRWFDELSPAAIIAGMRSEADTKARRGSDELDGLLTSLGRLSAKLQVNLPTSSRQPEETTETDVQDDKDEVGAAEAHFARGLLLGAADCSHPRTFRRIVRRLNRFYLPDAEKLLAELVDARDWVRCALFLRDLRPDGLDSWRFRLQAAVAAALVGDAQLYDVWVAPLLADRQATIRGSVSTSAALQGESQQVGVMAMNAFVFGFADPSKEPSGIREEIEAAFQKTTRDERKDAVMALTLRAAAMLGSFVATTTKGESRALHIDANTASRTLTALLEAKARQVNAIPFGFHEVASTLVRALVESSEDDVDIRAALMPVLRNHLSSTGGPDVFLETVWRTLAHAGDRTLLVDFGKIWVGEGGHAWREGPADRHDLVTRFARLLDEIGENGLAQEARQRLPWADIGYSGHKEYSLSTPLEWFRLLAPKEPASWEFEGRRLLGVSVEASRTGDNRMSSDVADQVLTAACLVGPDAVFRLASEPESVIGPGHRAILSGLLGMAENTSPSVDDILGIWAFATGQLCWQMKSDRGRLAEVHGVLTKTLERLGAKDAVDWMSKSAPAESSCSSDSADENDTEPEAVAVVAHQSVDEQMKAACAAQNWKAIAAALERLDKENPAGAIALVAQAWTALGQRPERIWWYDGAERTYRLIYPKLSPKERWVGVLRAVQSEYNDVPQFRASTLATNLDGFCRLTGLCSGIEPIKAGLRRLLEMHELWISGDGRLPPCPAVPIGDKVQASTAWRPLFALHLLQLLSFDEQEYVQATLRGLERLISLDHELCTTVIAGVKDGSPPVLRRFLLAAESIACHKSNGHVREWLQSEIDSNRLDVALAAWTALRTANRALGDPQPELPKRNRSARLVTPVARPLLIGAPSRHGLITVAARASDTVLKNLAEAIGDDVDDIRSEFADSIRRDPPSIRPERVRDRTRGDMIPDRRGEAELERLFTILRAHERDGRFADVPGSRLAQALVPFADPFVFLSTPRPSTRAAQWPVDESLDKLLPTGPILTGDTLAECLQCDLAEDLHLIGGTLVTYSRDMDAKVTVEHVISRRETSSDRPPQVLNARASLAFDPVESRIAKDGASDQLWLTERVGGLLYFAHGTLDLFPARAWTERLSWIPTNPNPLIWERDGRQVAWFEQVHGPIRDIYPSDYVYRQPIASRWVCLTDEWARLEDLLGRPQRRVDPEAAQREHF